MVYAAKASSGGISAESTIQIVIDIAENPLENPTTIFTNYIRYKGMDCDIVRRGYTADDPSLSITHYEWAPAWDDMIPKSDPDWISRVFWLIDQYKARGFKVAFFITTETEVALSAI